MLIEISLNSIWLFFQSPAKSLLGIPLFSSMVDILCPHCEEEIGLDDDASGEFSCPFCEGEFEWNMQPQMQGMAYEGRPVEMMPILDALKSCFQQYVGFSGRASRSEYWFFNLSFFIAAMGLLILTLVSLFVANALAGIMSFLSFVLYLGCFLPLLAVSVRRLHDLGKPGWMFFLGLIPIVGGILLLVWFVSDGQPYDNEYGPVPTNIL